MRENSLIVINLICFLIFAVLSVLFMLGIFKPDRFDIGLTYVAVTLFFLSDFLESLVN